MYLAWWRLFETSNEYMPGDAGWRRYGLDLSAAVLDRFIAATPSDC